MKRREFIALLGGSAVMWPPAARAQQAAMPVVGFLHSASPGPIAQEVAAFRQGLREIGYMVGQNIAIEYRWGDGQIERLPALAADLARLRVAVIAAVGGDATALAAKAAAPTIPIVFQNGSDPIKSGLVISLNRPGGNVTGVSLFAGTVDAKRLELMHELTPQITVIAVLNNPLVAEVESRSRNLQEAARMLGLRLLFLSVSSHHDFDRAFATIAEQKAGALFVDGGPFFVGRRDQLDDRFHETCQHGTRDSFVDSSFVVDQTRSGIMAGWRHAVELAMTDEEIARLAAIARSRTEAARRVERAQILLAYQENPSFYAVKKRVGVHHQTAERCVERALAYGPLAALDDRPRPGKEPTITPEAKAWLVSLACDKAKDHGYPHELWTTRLLARHARENAPSAGHECLADLVQGTVCKILGQQEIKPHKVRYYMEQRDDEFEQKMAEVLCVYREVQILKKAAQSKKPDKPVAIVSYDEKPGIQAIATTSPDLPPEPGVHATFARDNEYKRQGTLSLLAGIDLLTGKVHAIVRDRHRSREFIEFLKLLDAAYPASTAIKLILDNHSAHISKETRTWLATRSAGRFEFTFTPTHGSWLNLIEGFFSKFARSVLRHIRVASKQELKERIMAGIKDVNRHPVVHTWSYRLAEAA